MLKGFKDFLFRGNIVELAIAVVIGGAFTALVGSFTTAIIQPILASIGGVNADGLGFNILGSDGGETTFVNIGAVITAAITFFITAAVVYFIFIVPMNKITERKKKNMKPVDAAPTDNELLLQIRDLLKAQNATATGSDTPPAAPTVL